MKTQTKVKLPRRRSTALVVKWKNESRYEYVGDLNPQLHRALGGVRRYPNTAPGSKIFERFQPRELATIKRKGLTLELSAYRVDTHYELLGHGPYAYYVEMTRPDIWGKEETYHVFSDKLCSSMTEARRLAVRAAERALKQAERSEPIRRLHGKVRNPGGRQWP